jgi:hypothetical protein
MVTGMLSCEGQKVAESEQYGAEGLIGVRRPRCMSTCGTRTTRWPTRGRRLPQAGSVPQNVGQSEGEE